ncbi:Heat induced stress protein YflT [Paenibacillus sp. UNCCL117]|uniref:general stress protein n=1 Tax=unclassified Paenibacillus TaxID=185978 RepID=UPI0008882B1C|nr:MULTISPECIES: general stress protein [unclassified Paenibacillus]SDC14135.1 Heat induced stress protein YflT [Paenibacillus sp. cl123]SFW17235.1 Heat induced stress protein YflT [Paenibacillus sp. UNCCL117]
MMNPNNQDGRRQIVGVFETEQATISAIEELKSIGYTSDQISVVSRSKDEMHTIQEETGTKAPEGMAAGAATGGVLGGLTGLLASIGVLAIPGIGPLLAAGPIAATITGAAVGAGAGGLVGGLVGLGIPREEAERYNDYVKDNKLLVMVDALPGQRSHVYEVFRRYGTLNADTYVSLDGEPRNDLVREASTHDLHTADPASRIR